MKILVTGATGKLGGKIVDILLQKIPASQLAVSVRDPQKATHLREQGVDVRKGDFDNSESLDTAFAGIDRILIISTDGDTETRIKQHTNAVAAAERAKVKFIAYTSIADANNSTMFLAPPHVATEKAIKQTGIPYSFLRNNWYLENEVSTIQGVLAGAPWVTAAGTGKVGWVLQRDYAEATAAVLAGEGHENTIYELSGKLVSQEEFASTLGSVLDKDIPVQQVDDQTYAAIMKEAGVPDFVVPMLVEIQKGIRDGALEVESTDFEKLIGRPATPIQEALPEIVKGISK
ncbi:SDR family oxidoreductase [Aquibacillus koreensis]|uniref:SDR family oxidoreductase n=1 Tax=Aquibacillus koreensis TaxID=279446 RepID=A0A9X3WSM1_9BACI|nr:SDR family oxidoreductase [Aquibacillus koreensis]MCT2535503.1 SDR family oxidoreductase [Aquibacillus koreensis]MDC3422684.1 SDR family oxidoreductase [Aquibacillus koreensis]